MKEMKKKGQMQGLWLVILTIVIAGFAVFLGIQLLGGFQDAAVNFANTATNETGFVNSTGYTLSAFNAGIGAKNPVIIIINNGTGGETIVAANYTLTGNVIKNASASTWGKANITYSYVSGEEAYRAANKSISGNATFADYWTIIAIAAVLGIIIPLILWAVGGRKVK